MVKKYYLQIRDWLSRRTARFYYFLFVVLTVGTILPLKTSALPDASTIVGDISGYVLRFLLWLFYWLFIACMGKIATIGMKLVIWTSSFTNLTTMPAVNQTWIIVRNFSNLFFLLALLIIAFATILKIESYSYKKLLPKMILAAVLINFSKLICSVLVDASQIVMLTFVNAFKGAATQGLYYAFQLDKLVSITAPTPTSYGGEGNWSEADYLIGTVAAGAMITFMAVLLMTFAIILCARVVFIWTLTILSPFAFATSILPATQKYSQQWWSTFGRYVVVGPFLAFFIWLAMFIVVKAGTAGMAANLSGDISITTSTLNTTSATSGSYSASQAGSIGINSGANGIGSLEPTVIVNYLIATMMLLIGLQFSQQMATEIGSITGKIGNFPKQLAGWAAKTPFKLGWRATKAVSKFAYNGVADRLVQRGFIDINAFRQIEKFKHKTEEISKRRQDEGRVKHETMAKKGKFRSLDLAYESMFGVGEQLGFAGIGKKGFFRAARTYKKFEEGRGSSEALEQEKRAEIEALSVGADVFEAEVGNGGRQDREKNLNEVSSQIDSNSEINTQDAPLIIAALKEVKSKEEDKEKRDQIDVEIARVQRAANKKENFTVGGEFAVRIKDPLKEKQAAIQQERKEAGLDDPAKLASVLQLAQSSKYKEREEKLKDLRHEMAENAPIVDPEAARHVRTLVADASKGVETDNEFDLKDRLRQSLHEKDILQALGIVGHMAKVSHPNEIVEVLNEFLEHNGKAKVNNDGQGLMHGLDELLIKSMGADQQMVLTVMDDVGRSSKHNHQWAFTEGVGSKHGELYMRNERERQERIFIEMSKANLISEMQHGNRLAAGGYHIADRFGNQTWSGPMAGVAALLTRNAEKIQDAVGRGYHNFNDNQQLHYINNPQYVEALEAGFKGNKDAIVAMRIALLGMKREEARISMGLTAEGKEVQGGIEKTASEVAAAIRTERKIESTNSINEFFSRHSIE